MSRDGRNDRHSTRDDHHFGLVSLTDGDGEGARDVRQHRGPRRQIQQEALLKLKRRMLRNGVDRDSIF